MTTPVIRATPVLGYALSSEEHPPADLVRYAKNTLTPPSFTSEDKPSELGAGLTGSCAKRGLILRAARPADGDVG